MHRIKTTNTIVIIFTTLFALATVVYAGKDDDGKGKKNVQLGPRPFYLVDQMSDGDLKDKLARSAVADRFAGPIVTTAMIRSTRVKVVEQTPTAQPPMVQRRTVGHRTVGRRTVGRRTAGQRTAACHPMDARSVTAVRAVA